MIGSDHAGIELKNSIIEYIKQNKILPIDIIDDHDEAGSMDYPIIARDLVKKIKNGVGGVLICGSGIGMSIAANRFKGIRAALCCTVEMTCLCRQHNDANVLVLGARFINKETAIQCVNAFLSISFDGGRHKRRIELLDVPLVKDSLEF